MIQLTFEEITLKMTESMTFTEINPNSISNGDSPLVPTECRRSEDFEERSTKFLF